MKKDAFTIEFAMDNKYGDGAAEYVFEAVITIISKSFRLYHVSEITRKTNGGAIGLSDSYYLTSYPYPVSKDYVWKDAITFYSNNFLELIGNSIDEYLCQDHCMGNSDLLVVNQ